MLRDRWEQALNGHKRSGHGLALLILDLDHFKEVNDTMGHAVGDALLIEASARISHCLRVTDTLARMGGDEFAIILTELVDTDSIADLAQGILSSLHKPFFWRATPWWSQPALVSACYRKMVRALMTC